jgi:hypothetical protein
MTSVNTTGAVHSQHSNNRSAATPKGEKVPYDLQEIKRQVGITPFSQRIQIDSDGYSACPFHNGDSDKSFHIVQKENGAFIGTCFSECGKSFDAIDFVKRHDSVQTGEAIRKLVATIGENGEQPTTILHKPKPATPMTAKEWAVAGRAVTDADVATLAASRPKSATPSAATLNAMGFRVAGKGDKTFLAAPYRLGDTFHTIKARNIASKEFIQENAVSQKGLFNIDAVSADCDVYVVESELDAAILHENGHIVVSVISATQKQIEPEVLKRLTKARRIFLVGDQDAAGQICMENIAKLLPTEKVYRISFNDAKDVGELAKIAATIEATMGDEWGFKTTWDELRKDALSSWVAHNIPYASVIEAKPMEWTVWQMLPYGGLLLFSGKYGAYKSLWALFMAAGIEAGTSVFGRKVLRKIPVLYVDRENHQQTVGERRVGIGLPDRAVRYWGDWIDGMETPNLDDPRLAEFAIREKGVIIFDSLTDWLDGANENDPSAMTDIMRKFRRLSRMGAGVILLHHADKYRSGYRGSTAIPAGVDMAMKAQKTEDGVLQVREEKFRMCKSWEMDVTFDFKGQYTYRVLRDQKTDDRRQAETADETEIVRTILAAHHEEHKGAAMNQTQLLNLLKAAGVSKTPALAIIAKGVREKIWAFKAGARNAVLYSLNGWKPADATN